MPHLDVKFTSSKRSTPTKPLCLKAAVQVHRNKIDNKRDLLVLTMVRAVQKPEASNN